MTDVSEATEGGIRLSEDMVERVNSSLAAKHPILVAYADSDGQPHISFRGSTHVHSADQLALWVRNPEGGLLKALTTNPRLTFMYRDPESRTTFYFYGHGHAETSEELRKSVYEATPEPEQKADPERKGLPVIVDLDLVEGGSAAGRISMRRA